MQNLAVFPYPIMVELLYMVARRGMSGTFCWCFRNVVTVKKCTGEKFQDFDAGLLTSVTSKNIRSFSSRSYHIG